MDAEGQTPATRLRGKDLLGIAELDPEEILLMLDTAEAMKEVSSAADQEGARAARQDRDQPLLRAEHADAHVVRDCREAAQRGHVEHRRQHLRAS